MQTLNPAILITHGSDTLAWHCFHEGGGVAVHVGHEVPHAQEPEEIRGVERHGFRQEGLAD